MSALVLASASPRRREILAMLGVPFEARPSGAPEREQGDPEEVAVENARRKAASVDGGGRPVLGVDTVVALDGRLYPKPADAREAEATLRALSGRTHEVVSGIALAGPAGILDDSERTRVTFVALSDARLRWYLESGEWEDRAGAYAIQGRGAALVGRIEGEYFNVVGLPVQAFLRLMGRGLG